jgi:urea transporter/murein DD-endopeptidase MepM/ murein hydrolase activator NlpD
LDAKAEALFEKNTFLKFIGGIANSYSIIFFSDKLYFSVIIFLVTFIDYNMGLSGLIAAASANLIALIIGLDKYKVKMGFYGFNSLLAGLGLGLVFEFSGELLIVILMASLLNLFIVTALEGFLMKYNLPYLSVPFLFTFWLIIPAGKNLLNFELSVRGIFVYNEIFRIGGYKMVEFYDYFQKLDIPLGISIFIKSLSASYFHYSFLGGLLVAAGLLIHSRISFISSLIGFFTAYAIYSIFGIPYTETSLVYIGFNYIFFGIAIGSHFFVPSYRTFLWVIFTIPLLVILTVSLSNVLVVWGLPVYALPFNILVLLFIYTFKFRYQNPTKIYEVYYQTFSPEENLYNYVNSNIRFRNKSHYFLRLPFYGEWYVSQGYNGTITHKDRWRHGIDFVITDRNGLTFKNTGTKLEEYYCYNKAILAPADGTVEAVVDGIEDNEIGNVNIQKNWGNTIVIKHGQDFYTQMSHLKAGTIKVKEGDYVKSGQAIAACGSSGRSPEPHLHFQVQTRPEVGADTIDYPFGNYLKRRINANRINQELIKYDKPEEKDTVSNIDINSLLKDTFEMPPGKELNIKILKHKDNAFVNTEEAKLKVEIDIYNNKYIYDSKNKCYAYFEDSNGIFYFYDFIGKRKSPLYELYLAAYIIPLGFYEGIEVRDSYPLHKVYSKIALLPQDIAAPFYVYLHSDYKLKYIEQDNPLSPGKITLHSFVYKGTRSEKEQHLFKKYILEIFRDSVSIKVYE